MGFDLTGSFSNFLSKIKKSVGSFLKLSRTARYQRFYPTPEVPKRLGLWLAHEDAFPEYVRLVRLPQRPTGGAF